MGSVFTIVLIIIIMIIIIAVIKYISKENQQTHKNQEYISPYEEKKRIYIENLAYKYKRFSREEIKNIYKKLVFLDLEDKKDKTLRENDTDEERLYKCATMYSTGTLVDLLNNEYKLYDCYRIDSTYMAYDIEYLRKYLESSINN